jgi:cell filamentation protein, protein adenylyltransferase
MSQERRTSDTTAPWDPQRPHTALPRLVPLAGDLETRSVLKQCTEARAALAELKQASSLIPNPAMLINTLPVLEARASSAIENIVTTADALFRQLNAEKAAADPATKEALRYRQALFEGLDSLRARPLGTRTAEQVCGRILDVEAQVRRVPGTRLINDLTGEVVYTPPEGETLLRDLLADWERFLHDHDEVDPLVRMAAGHYQFEAIHPFTDGNGRTGRVLNSLYLVELELLPQPILYLSRYILAHRSDYYTLLRAVTRSSAWEPWLLFMLRGVRETATWTVAKIAAIRELAEETARHLRARVPAIYSRELVDLIFEQPYCRIGNLVAAGIVARQAASRYLKALAAAGVLEERAFGREKLFLHPRLLDLLSAEGNDFAPYPARSSP